MREIEEAILQLKNRKDSFQCHTPYQQDSAIATYLNYYQLPTEVSYYFGRFNGKKDEVNVQAFEPKDSIKATILLVHGYYDHTGCLRHLIRFLIEEKYRVVSVDLQGHGLSAGTPYHIHDFNAYSQMVSELTEFIQAQWKTTLHVIAHSTGGAAVITSLLERRIHVEKVILLAPLVRSAHWFSTLIGYYTGSLFVRNIKRKLREYNGYSRKEDPLQYTTFPVSWLQAMIRWNHSIQKSKINDKEIAIIQGERDTTVDWRYNCRFLSRRFPNSRVRFIEQGRHQLVNESDDIRSDVLTQIKQELDF
ncbi:alpha/beta hydrolase [Bacillus alkalicellulosilyticus]|uniref:alpha/beta hydrolase n=1 Tax=Alkalihalobacterium alkalicellulosilyticum TaxID=1912214 RepID=UPI0014832258|nr:alpha/beta hydrolase [Bacillus alkalicellulosilyticus]